MKTKFATTVTLVMGGVLTGSVVSLYADSTPSPATTVDDIVYRHVVPVQQLPSDVTHGSIWAGGADEHALAGMAKIEALDAINTVNRESPGRIIELALEKENGYLVWEVTREDADGREVELAVDAGNGQILAADFDDRQDSIDKDDEDRDGDAARPAR